MTFLSYLHLNFHQVSKKKAAEAMLKLLRTLPPLLHHDDLVEEPLIRKGKMAPKKKRQNLIKVQKGNTDYGQGINPISRLIQIQQAKREKEPSFALLTERGLPRRREFVMQVDGVEIKSSSIFHRVVKCTPVREWYLLWIRICLMETAHIRPLLVSGLLSPPI